MILEIKKYTLTGKNEFYYQAIDENGCTHNLIGMDLESYDPRELLGKKIQVDNLIPMNEIVRGCKIL